MSVGLTQFAHKLSMPLEAVTQDGCCLRFSPSLGIGTTSDVFQAAGKTDDNKERFIVSVRIGRIQGKASLMTVIGILSYPGALSMEMSSLPFAPRCWISSACTFYFSIIGHGMIF